MAGWFLLVAAAAGWRDVPLIDDWTYAWTVEHLLRTGTFRVLDWSSTSPLSQAVWGAAWSAVLGSSFASLRLSTIALALAGSWALYLTLRELGARSGLALAGSLGLAMNPVFVLLSASFMTDVPFVALTAIALLCYVRAATRNRVALVWWAGMWSLLAFLTRAVGVVMPAAGLPLLLRPGDSSRRRFGVAVALAVPWGAMVLAGLLMRQRLGSTSVMTRWLWNLEAGVAVAPNVRMVLLVSFYLLPVLLAAAGAHRLSRRPLALLAGVVAVAGVVLAVLGEIPPPLGAHQNWTLLEVGASRALLSGRLSVHEPPWLGIPLRAVNLLALTVLVAICFSRTGPLRAMVGRYLPDQLLRHLAWRRVFRPEPGSPSRRPGPDGGHRAASAARGVSATGWHQEASLRDEDRTGRRCATGDASPILEPSSGQLLARASLVAYLAALVVLTNLLWTFHDRYYLPLLPPLIALTLGIPGAPARLSRPAIGALVIFGAVGLVGAHDALRVNEAAGEAVRALTRRGVPLSEIDAGYAWNGWLLYAHPENLGPDRTPRQDVPWVTSERRPRYVIATTPLEGYDVMREVAWSGLPWPAPTRLLVLERRCTPTDP
jgi:4-amino-4-deoxy-L-arabinose transferase-like glycosyltransferase